MQQRERAAYEVSHVFFASCVKLTCNRLVSWWKILRRWRNSRSAGSALGRNRELFLSSCSCLQERKIHQLLAEIGVLESVNQQQMAEVARLRQLSFDLETELRRARLLIDHLRHEKESALVQLMDELQRSVAVLTEVVRLRRVPSCDTAALIKSLETLGGDTALEEQLQSLRTRQSEASQQLELSRASPPILSLLPSTTTSPALSPATSQTSFSSTHLANSSSSNTDYYTSFPPPAAAASSSVPVEAKLVIYPQSKSPSKRRKDRIVLRTNRFMSLVPLLNWWAVKSFPKTYEIIV